MEVNFEGTSNHELGEERAAVPFPERLQNRVNAVLNVFGEDDSSSEDDSSLGSDRINSVAFPERLQNRVNAEDNALIGGGALPERLQHRIYAEDNALDDYESSSEYDSREDNYSLDSYEIEEAARGLAGFYNEEGFFVYNGPYEEIGTYRCAHRVGAVDEYFSDESSLTGDSDPDVSHE